MLTRRAILAAVPALAACAAPCGPTNPPQPGLVHIGRLDMGQDLHGSDPDPLMVDAFRIPGESVFAAGASERLEWLRSRWSGRSL